MNIYNSIDTIIVSSLQTISICENALHKYLSLVNTYLENPPKENYEKHHILPRSLFPEYKNLNANKWNCVKLPYAQHLEAHRLLMILTNKAEMIWSYQYMSNNGRWSEYLTGQQLDDYELSRKSSNKLIHARDKNGNTLIVKKDDIRFLNGIIKPFHSGTQYYNDGVKNYKFHPCFDIIPGNMKKGKLATKKSHTKGKILYNNGVINKFFKKGSEPDNFIEGKLPNKKPKKITNRKWYNNGRETIIVNGNNIPFGYVSGNLHTKNKQAKNKNKICYNDGIRNIYLHIDDEIPDNFNIGAKGRNKRYGKICINNGSMNLYIDKNDTIPEGFKRGEYRKNKLPSNTKGLKWYNNGKEEKMFNPLNDIPHGYISGKLTSSTSGKEWYNNKKINKMFDKNSSIPDDFIKGKLQKNRKK